MARSPAQARNGPVIQILPDGDTLARVAADLVVRYVQDATVNRGRATVALSGGATPRRLESLLASPPHSTRLDFSAIDLFFVDERCVPPDDLRSNYYWIRKLLLDPAGVLPQRVHRIRGELDPAAGAADYERDLREFFSLAAGKGSQGRLPQGSPALADGADWPVMDLVLLGLGADGHTASLFPGDGAIDETRHWAVAVEAGAEVRHRVTLTLPLINHARQIVFLVEGPEKAAAVAGALGGQGDVAGCPGCPAGPASPAALVRPVAGQVRWLLSESAAGALGLPGKTTTDYTDFTDEI